MPTTFIDFDELAALVSVSGASLSEVPELEDAANRAYSRICAYIGYSLTLREVVDEFINAGVEAGLTVFQSSSRPINGDISPEITDYYGISEPVDPDYFVQTDFGLLLKGITLAVYEKLSMTYQSGYETTLPDELKAALTNQIVFEYTNRKSIGVSVETGGFGTATKQGFGFVSGVTDVLDAYKVPV